MYPWTPYGRRYGSPKTCSFLFQCFFFSSPALISCIEKCRPPLQSKDAIVMIWSTKREQWNDLIVYRRAALYNQTQNGIIIIHYPIVPRVISAFSSHPLSRPPADYLHDDNHSDCTLTIAQSVRIYKYVHASSQKWPFIIHQKK